MHNAPSRSWVGCGLLFNRLSLVGAYMAVVVGLCTLIENCCGTCLFVPLHALHLRKLLIVSMLPSVVYG